MAIKTAKKHTPGSDFQQEMAIMSTLSHQNIVHFYGLVEQGTYYHYAACKIKFKYNNVYACTIVAEQSWIVLEFLTHGDLKTFLTVSLTVAPSYCVKIIDNIMHNNNHTLTEK